MLLLNSGKAGGCRRGVGQFSRRNSTSTWSFSIQITIDELKASNAVFSTYVIVFCICENYGFSSAALGSLNYLVV